MVLDNNVTHQMFTREFAAARKLAVKGTIIGTKDHAGVGFDADRLEDILVTVGDRTIVLDHAGAFEMDPSFGDDRLAGILPVDALLDTGYVLIAPSAGRLIGYRASAADVLAAFITHGWRADSVPTTRDALGHLYIEATLPGRSTTWASFDLGGSVTEASLAYAGGAFVDSVCVVVSASGACQWGVKRPHPELSFATGRLPLDTLVVTRIAGGASVADVESSLLLGMDALAKCSFAIPIRHDGPVLLGCTQ